MNHLDALPPPPNGSVAETQAPLRQPIPMKRFIAATTLGLVAGLPSAAAGGEMLRTGDPNPISAARHAGEALLNEFGFAECPPIPADATMVQIKQEVTTPPTQHYSEAKAAAVANGLTFAESLYPINALLDSETPTEATELASDYMEQEYGFALKLDMPPEKQTAIDKPKYAQDLLGMMAYTSLLPSELVRAPEVLRINITDLYDQTKHEVDGKPIGHIGLFDPSTRTVTLDINYVNDIGVFAHEFLGHGVQNTVCNGAQTEGDPALSSQNPAGFAYNNSETSSQSPATENVTASGYGNKNVQEDNAELVRTYLIGDNANYLQSLADTSADNKLAIILNRFDEIAPGSSTYLAAVRPEFRRWQPTANAPLAYTAPVA